MYTLLDTLRARQLIEPEPDGDREALRMTAAGSAALAYLAIMAPGRAAGAEIHTIEVHYLLARLRHDTQWLTATARRIEAGELLWPDGRG